MAKKMNSLAADFEGLNKSADDKMFAMLRTAEREPTEVRPVEQKMKTRKSAAPSESKQDPKTSVAATTEAKRKKEKPKTELEWGKPVAHFNTRIPEKMAELLDDLVYKLRKKGDQKTKQDLAQEALNDLLRKHSIC